MHSMADLNPWTTEYSILEPGFGLGGTPIDAAFNSCWNNGIFVKILREFGFSGKFCRTFNGEVMLAILHTKIT